jgi:hypothetical protein
MCVPGRHARGMTVAYVLVACRVLLLLVFVASALGKIRSRTARVGFVQSLRDLRLVPDGTVRAVAAGVIGGEVGAVLLLAAPATVPVGLALAGALLVAFTVSILVTLRRGVRAPCRCFGSAALPLGRRHVLRNGLLLAVVALCALSLASTPTQAHPAGLAVAAAAGLTGGALLVFFDELVELYVGPMSSAGPLGKGSM